MSDPTAPHRVLHLIIEGFPAERVAALNAPSPGAGDITEVFQLTEASAPEALKKIFAADTVAVWSDLSHHP